MAPIKVGVVGYGGAAKNFHIPFISAIPDYEIIAILQRAEAPANAADAAPGSHCTVDLPNIRHYRTSEDFFGDADIQFVVVATRHDTHAYFAEEALKAGKHGMLVSSGAHRARQLPEDN
jgi:predicted dehydrogenase